MSNSSEQKITVLCDFSDSMNGVILHGIRIARFLQKQLCLLSFTDRNTPNKTAIHNRLSEISSALKQHTHGMIVSSLVLKNTLEEQIETLADRYDSVLIVMNKQMLSPKLKALRESNIPFLFVDGKTTDLISYKNVALPVDFRKEMKETSLWASYFGRFNNAFVNLFPANDSNKEDQSMVKRNVIFIRKFLAQLNLHYELTESRKSSWKIQFECLKLATSRQNDVLIILGSKNISPIDYLIGLPEKKIIAQAGMLPVLCINPTKDMNILCD